MTTTIPVHPDLVATVDDEDAPMVAGFRWRASYAGGLARYPGGGVVAVASREPQGHRDDAPRTVYLDRLIANVHDTPVEHLNGDGLDCRKANLRVPARGRR